MNITQLEKEIIRVLKINENVDWDFSDIPPKEEFKELQIFIKRLFKEYRAGMTQRDEGHDFRDSKNKAQAYERNKKLDTQANDLINIFFEFLCDSDLEKFIDDNCSLTREGKHLLKLIKTNLKS